jgi:hypothetical protein
MDILFTKGDGMVTSKQSQDIGRLEGKIDAVSGQIAHLEQKMYGNGQPGLIPTMAEVQKTIELHCADQATDAKFIADATRKLSEDISKLTSNVYSLSDSVKQHHGDKSMHTIWGQITWKAAAVLIAFIAIVTLIIPQELTIWQLIAKLFGL